MRAEQLQDLGVLRNYAGMLAVEGDPLRVPVTVLVQVGPGLRVGDQLG